jgi:hypothetical protein
MMRHRSVAVALTCLGGLVCAGLVAASMSASYPRMLKSAESLARLADDGSSDGAYFNNPWIKTEYPRSLERLADIRAALVDKELSAQDQKLAVRLAQCLPLDRYVELLRDAVAWHEKGELRSEVLDALVNPGSQWGTLLSMNWRDGSVRALLTDIAQRKSTTPQTRDYIKTVLDGSDAKFIAEHREFGEKFPVLQCKAATNGH